MTRHLFTIVALLAAIMSSCRPDPLSSASNTAGYGSHWDISSNEVTKKSQTELVEIVRRIIDKGLLDQLRQGTLGVADSRKVIAGYLFEEIKRSGGLRRDDAAEVLRQLASATAPTRSGEQPQVFNFPIDRADTIDNLLDGILLRAAASPEQCGDYGRGHRNLVIKSLAPTKNQLDGSYSLASEMRAIVQRAPFVVGENAPNPREVADKASISSLCGIKFVEAIDVFSTPAWDNIRYAQSLGPSRASDSPVTRRFYDFAVAIEEGITKLAIIKQTVYRSLRAVSAVDLKPYLESWHRGTRVGLARNNEKVTTSATWKIKYAYGRTLGSDFQSVPPTYGVMFEIINHRGVGIEALSQYPFEGEVLLPANSTYRVEGIEVVTGKYPVFHIKLNGAP